MTSSLLRQRRGLVKVADRLRRDVERLKAIRDSLSMPPESEHEPMLAGTQPLDEAVELAHDIECVIVDRLEPAIEALEKERRAR